MENWLSGEQGNCDTIGVYRAGLKRGPQVLWIMVKIYVFLPAEGAENASFSPHIHKTHKTWGPLFSPALYSDRCYQLNNFLYLRLHFVLKCSLCNGKDNTDLKCHAEVLPLGFPVEYRMIHLPVYLPGVLSPQQVRWKRPWFSASIAHSTPRLNLPLTP